MATSASRFKPTSSQKQSTTRAGSTNANTVSPAGNCGHSRLTEIDILELAYGIPSLHSSPDLQLSSLLDIQPTSKHGRSMSHPFPSLFLNKQKCQGVNDLGASDSSDGDNRVSLSQSVLTGKLTRVPDKVLVTGKCMTCDSTVRWPKELLVFRCTVCLTINDLKSVYPTSPDGGMEGVYSLGVMPLSIAKTRALIEQCITSYILDRLTHDEGAAEPAGSRHGISCSLPRRPSHHPSGMLTKAQSKAWVDTFDESVHVTHYSNDLNSSSAPHLSSLMVHGDNSHSHNRLKDSRELKGVENFDTGKATQKHNDWAENIFKPLEDYIITSFVSRECVNSSFATSRPDIPPRAASQGTRRMIGVLGNGYHQTSVKVSEMDAKTPLIGNFAENGVWWTGEREPVKCPNRSGSYHKNTMESSNLGTKIVNLKSPEIDWADLSEWYDMVLLAGCGWRCYLRDIIDSGKNELLKERLSPEEMDEMEDQISEAQVHTQRILLKATESLLKRPGALLKQPDDIRFLLIILANPLLHPLSLSPTGRILERSRSKSRKLRAVNISTGPNLLQRAEPSPSQASSREPGPGPGQHSGIIKRVLGLLSNLPNECHHHLVAWFARFSANHFQRITEMVGSFAAYRLTRQHEKQHQITKQDHPSDLIPNWDTTRRSASSALHATLGVSRQHGRNPGSRPRPAVYNDDWQIKAAARVMALLFSANSVGAASKYDTNISNRIGMVIHERTKNHGQILPISAFYNSLLDCSDLIADFEAWESGRGKFTFCQYPFFLSIWAKIQIMEHDARRQMEIKAREAFFDSIMTRKTVNQYLVLRIRRECLVEDSLKSISEVVGSGGEEIKKGLRIEFKGEEGIDAGGLRKEWFLLLVRDVFNPEHGMFVYDEDSRFCYFNPNSFETSDQYFLVGVVLGLAIYNSTILDVALPPFAFRKLLAAGPTTALGGTSHTKQTMTCSLKDLAEFRPTLANGLRQLLEYDGNVEETFCRDFVADVERYGQIVQIPLCLNGEILPVTNANRREFVDLYVRYLLDTAVSRQFEPFKRGFFTVCGGNALSLFHPEEIELLIRGSDEPLDIASLQAAAIYENWGISNAAEIEPVIEWFWDAFQHANPRDQRKLLSFITGSDRIPAMGAASLLIKLSCLGDDSPRFPIARTCFNMLSLCRYSSREKLESMLWRAVNESEGFGLK